MLCTLRNVAIASGIAWRTSQPLLSLCADADGRDLIMYNMDGWSSVLRPSQHNRLYRRRFLQVKRPNQQYQSTEGDATKEKENNENN